jgi:hypothetical protein
MDEPGSESCKMADYGISAIESCSSIKGREFVDWLNRYKLLMQEAPHVVRPNSFLFSPYLSTECSCRVVGTRFVLWRSRPEDGLL